MVWVETKFKYFCGAECGRSIICLPPWLSPVERLAVNQSVKGSNPFGGAMNYPRIVFGFGCYK